MNVLGILACILVVIFVVSMVVYRAIYNRRIKKTLEGKDTSKKIWPTPFSVGISIVCLALVGILVFQTIQIDELKSHSINYELMDDFDCKVMKMNGEYHTKYYVVGEKLQFDSLISDEDIKGFANQISISSDEIKNIKLDDNYFTLLVINDLDGEAELTREDWNYLAKTVKEQNNFGVVYAGNSDYEMMTESGFFTDETSFNGEQVLICQYHLNNDPIYTTNYIEFSELRNHTLYCNGKEIENPTDNMHLVYEMLYDFDMFFGLCK